jgi:hypothetical protein
MHSISALCAAGLLVLAGCAATPPSPPISVINSLSFEHALTGKPDGLRSAWPLGGLANSTENFPMAQIKQCDASGAACKWGVLKARRSFGAARAVEGGVMLELDLLVEVDRSGAVAKPEQGALTIPSDVGALQLKRQVKRDVMLPFGKVERIELEYGIRFELCAYRLDGARQPVEECAIPYH